MNHNILSLTIFILIFAQSELFAQSRPSLQLSGGLIYPGNEFAGDLVTKSESGNIFISEDFLKNNYSAAAGVSVTGTLKFPFEKSGTLNGIFLGSYSYFNAFRRSEFGSTVENNIVIPVNYDNRISITTFAFGVDATAAANSQVSPFVNTSLSLNIFSLTLSTNDATSVIFNDAFRMGMLSNAGVRYRINQEYSFVLSGSYHMSNLFFKTESGSYSDRIGFYRDNIPINDEEGSYYSNLSDPNSEPQLIQGNTKHINWWGINLGISIMLGKSKK